MPEINKIQLSALSKGNHKAFKLIYELYFMSLLKYSLTFVSDKEIGYELVQEAFLMMWERRNIIDDNFNVKAYLYKSVHNQALNYIRHQKIVFKHISESKPIINSEDKTPLPEPFLNNDISIAINNLPKRLKQIFILSRIEGFKHKEIAKKLAITEKTVEVHIRSARLILRKKLNKYYKELNN